MQAGFQTLYRYGELLGFTADLFGGSNATFSEQLSDALAAGNQLNAPEHRLGVAGASTPMGAIEVLSASVGGVDGSVAQAITAGLSEIAEAIGQASE